MHVLPRGGLLGLGLPDPPVVSALVNDVGHGLGDLLGPKPKHTPPPTQPAPVPTNSPLPTSSSRPSNPGSGSGNPGNGSGGGNGSGSSSDPNPGGGNSSPSQSAGSGNPTQSPTDGQSAPSQQPSTAPQGPGPEPVVNVATSPSGTSLVTNPSDNAQTHDPAISSIFTSSGTVFAISGSQTITVPSNFGFTQPPSASSTNNDNNPGGAVAKSTHHNGVPGVAIGLIVAAFVLIGLFGAVFVMRRVHQRRRADRRTRWAPVMAETAGGASRSSVRSSFATTFDYGLRAQSPVPVSEMPILPPLSHIAEPKRASIESDHSQWLMVDRPEDLLGGNGSLSPVAPFTPSESYKFPDPPKGNASGSDDLNPFSDNAGKPSAPNSNTDEKPVIQVGVAVTVKRPFAPSLPDELYISPGQVVFVEQMFDDGWNLVKANDGSRGLVPLACFEDAEQPNGIDKRRSSLIDFTN